MAENKDFLLGNGLFGEKVHAFPNDERQKIRIF
jgi:hypothetical protein